MIKFSRILAKQINLGFLAIRILKHLVPLSRPFSTLLRTNPLLLLHLAVPVRAAAVVGGVLGGVGLVGPDRRRRRHQEAQEGAQRQDVLRQ